MDPMSVVVDPEQAHAGTTSDSQSRTEPAYAGPAGSVPTAEVAECTCPDFCERDHANE
jgi:hypothetical protein